MLKAGTISISPGRRQVFGPDGVMLRLTGAMFDTLRLLVEARGQTVPLAMIGQVVLGRTDLAAPHAVSILVCKLRARLPRDWNGRSLIRTVHGGGYAIEPVVAEISPC